ncbi:hypothetical protein ACFFGV_07190 [Pontibacillus salicampi]|uniref:Uncharacterized protein n=1 Tax=Pontibacillus salicampi TaxID=1449801 RepID=A0ABV6LLW2_9BACI
MSQQRRGVNKWLVMLLVFVVVLGIGATAYGVLKENNPMALYAIAEKNTIEEQLERMQQYNKHTATLQERMLEEAHTSEATLAMNADMEGEQLNQTLPQAAMVQGILSTIKLKVDSQVDPSTNEMSGKLDVQLQGTSLAEASLYQNKETTAAQIPFLHNDYFAIHNNELGDFLKRIDAEEPTVTEIPNFVESNKAAFTSGQLEDIVIDYVKAVRKHFSEDQFSLEKSASYEGDTFDKVTISISEEKTQAIVKTVLEKLKEDERIWNVVDKQMQLQQLNPTEERETIQAELDKAISNVDQLSLPEGITIEAYIKDEIVVHEIWSMDLQLENSPLYHVKWDSSYKKEGKDSYDSSMDMTATADDSKEEYSLSYHENGKPNKDGLHVDYTIGVDVQKEDEDFQGTLVLNTDYTETSANTQFDVKVKGTTIDPESVPSISGFFNSETTQKKADSYMQKLDLGFDIGMDDPNIGVTNAHVEFHVDQQHIFTNDLSFPDTNGESTIQVMEKSEDEWNQITEEMQRNFQQYIQNMMGGLNGFSSLGL